MGYIAHHAIVVEGYDKWLAEAHAEARGFLGERVSEITPEGVNGSASFFVPPDGSKEGWSTSEEFDTARDAFVGWLRENPNHGLDWIEVRFGGDDPQFARIERYVGDDRDDD